MARKVLGLIGLVSYLAGIYQLILDRPWPNYEGGITGGWLMVINFLWWVWLILTPIALLAMVSEEDTRSLSFFVSFIWLVILITSMVDAIFYTPDVTHVLTNQQLLLYGLLLFFAPGILGCDFQEDLKRF